MNAPGGEKPLEGIGWDLDTDEASRVRRIADEAAAGFSALRRVEPAVAIFGSARSHETSPEYDFAREVAKAVARTGFNVITGGGPANQTQILVTEIYRRACGYFQFGQASSMTLLAFLLLLAVSILQWRLFYRKEV